MDPNEHSAGSKPPDGELTTPPAPHDHRQILLRQAGALADDAHLPQMRTRIYEERGRPEVDSPLENDPQG